MPYWYAEISEVCCAAIEDVGLDLGQTVKSEVLRDEATNLHLLNLDRRDPDLTYLWGDITRQGTSCS